MKEKNEKNYLPVTCQVLYRDFLFSGKSFIKLRRYWKFNFPSIGNKKKKAGRLGSITI